MNNTMEKFAKDIVGKLDTPAILNSRFTHLLDSLAGIRKLSQLGNEHPDKQELIDTLMQSVVEHLGVEEVSLYLFESDSLYRVATLNWEKFIKNKSSIKDEKQAYLPNEGIIGKITALRKVIHITNCKTTKEKIMSNESNSHKMGSLICAPIMANDSLIGILELSHPDIEHFDSWQEHSAIVYADLIGMLLNNNKLIQNMQSIVDVRTKELQNALEESEKLRARYEEMSVIDHLTKLYNRRFFFSEVTTGLARAKRYSQAFSLMLMDLDHFKEVNDTHGHECGDNVLKGVAEILTRFTREGDTLARFGGEEFVLALPNTNLEGTIKLAERIRSTIEEYAWECNKNNMVITISIGLTSLRVSSDDDSIDDECQVTQVTDILREADRALYHVKQHGRNAVKAFSELSNSI